MPLHDSPGSPDNEGREAGRCRLTSWKEIAAIAGRTEGTVRRWEQTEGMPVHRHQHGALGTVYAFTDEIDSSPLSRCLKRPAIMGS